MLTELNVISPGIPTQDNCPILRRLNAFVAQEGVAGTLQFTFRDPGTGAPIDFSNDVVEVSIGSESKGSEVSESLTQAGNPDILVRFREYTGYMSNPCNVYSVEGTVIDAANGVVRANIPKSVYGQSGLYSTGWAIVKDNTIVYNQNAILSVERSLFGFSTFQHTHTEGPPTLGEIRMQLRDSDAGDNPLLRDVEFSDDQVLMALAKPVQYFNETNPPLTQRFDTRNFPWKYNWIEAVGGYLYEMAAAYYRRNRLAITGGGKQLDALNRETEYLRISKLKIDEWKDWVLRKKVELNMKQAVGSIGSDYGRWQ